MTDRWTTPQVLALAPDEGSRRAASGLARQSSWTGWGTAVNLIWGLCAGSGKNPYQTIVDLAGPAFKCSCPSRKFPCKHALALLLAWSAGAVPEQDEPSDYARAWQSGRTAAAAARAAKAQHQANGDDDSEDAPAERRSARGATSTAAERRSARGATSTAAATRRAEQRARRVAAGVTELQTWLRDQVRSGLASAQAGGYRHTEAIAARMVDAQAPGLASALRALAPVPASGTGWPGRLLAEYAQLHLLTRAYEQVETLPPGLAAVVRSRVGYTTTREDVLAAPAVRDRWQVLGARDLPDAPVPARRTWLRGQDTGKPALLLAFSAGPSGGFRSTPDAALAPGTELDADVHYYPGQPPLRAVIGERRTPVTASPRPQGAIGIAALLDEWTAALEQDPWLTEWPALLAGTPVPPGSVPPGSVPPGSAPPGSAPPGSPPATGRWHLTDRAGLAVPLLGGEPLWTLLAVSGGQPVTVAGEWTPDGFIPLTVWHENRAVPL